MAIVNLGIVAHVDAGKTTLTEQLLYRCGVIAEPGRVDEGTTQTDRMEIERQRGISVEATLISFPLRDLRVNLIDTPGHADFICEVERALRVLDAAILVVSAVEGVQAQTKVLWEALQALKIPTFVFLNKVDRVGADVPRVLEDMAAELGGAFALADAAHREELTEALCGQDDDLLARYLEGEAIGDDEMRHQLARQIKERKIFPALPGAALHGQGVEELIDFLYAVAPRARGDEAGETAGLVYRVTHDAAHGRVAHVRLYSGTVRNRDALYNHRLDQESKVFQIRRAQGKKIADAGALCAGDIAMVYGLGPVRVGDVLGKAELVPEGWRIAEPLLRARVLPEPGVEFAALWRAMEELSAEDPMLGCTAEGEELTISVNGSIQLEILPAMILQRFGLRVGFDKPSVIYKETPSTICEGFEAYTMPKPCWAVIRLLIEPLPRGSGVVYESDISNEKIHYRYQGQISQTIPEALRQGPLGWEVTDIRLTLIDGGDHPIHTHPLDFTLATPLAVMDGLVRGGTTLLEPMLRVQIGAPEEFLNRVIGDFLQMRGQFDNPHIQEGSFTLGGRLPLATSLDYPTRLTALTGGRATLSQRFDGYEPCPIELGAIAPYRGVDPRDRSKYILWKRGAIQQ